MLIKKNNFGLEIKIKDLENFDELKIDEVFNILEQHKRLNKKISSLIDLSDSYVQSKLVIENIEDSMNKIKSYDIIDKVAILFKHSISKLQIMNKSMKAGLYSKEKYFSTKEENFREKAIEWIINDI